MALTIGRNWPRSAPRGDYAAVCDICQVRYRRSQLQRMPSGLLACRGPGTNNDARGREALTLDRQNQEGYAGRARTPRQDGGAMDALEPLLLQQLSATPVGAWCVGERISSTYTGSILQLSAEPDVNDADDLDIGYSTSTNMLDTDTMLSTCKEPAGNEDGPVTGYCGVLYDQSGNGRNLTCPGNFDTTAPKIWRPTVDQFYGRGDCPMLFFQNDDSVYLGRSDSCGISGDSDVTMFAVYSGLGNIFGIGGLGAGSGADPLLSGLWVAQEDVYPATDVSYVTVDFAGDTPEVDAIKLYYTAPKQHTLASDTNSLYAVTIRRSAGDATVDISAMLDGSSISRVDSPLGLSLRDAVRNGVLGIADTRTRVGHGRSLDGTGQGLDGYLYAAMLWDERLTDADVEALETWAQKAIDRSRDHRGLTAGSRKP